MDGVAEANYSMRAKTLWMIQRRLVVANSFHLAAAPHLDKEPRIRRKHVYPLEKALRGTAHTVTWHGQSAACTACGSACGVRGVVEWLGTECRVLAPQAPGIWRQSATCGKLRAGNAELHPTHTLLTKRGIAWCGSCGCHTTVAAGFKAGANGARASVPRRSWGQRLRPEAAAERPPAATRAAVAAPGAGGCCRPGT